MIIGDSNAEVGGDLRTDMSNLNFMMILMKIRGLADFSVAIHLEIRRYSVPTQKIHKELWVWPDGHTSNQIYKFDAR